MRHVGDEIGLRDLGRPHPAEIAGHLGIEMQRDEVGEVIFVQPLGGQSVGAEVIHCRQIAAFCTGCHHASGAQKLPERVKCFTHTRGRAGFTVCSNSGRQGAMTASYTPLPGCFRGDGLHCFVARTPRNDGWKRRYPRPGRASRVGPCRVSSRRSRRCRAGAHQRTRPIVRRW